MSHTPVCHVMAMTQYVLPSYAEYRMCDGHDILMCVTWHTGMCHMTQYVGPSNQYVGASTYLYDGPTSYQYVLVPHTSMYWSHIPVCTCPTYQYVLVPHTSPHVMAAHTGMCDMTQYVVPSYAEYRGCFKHTPSNCHI